MCWYLLYLYLIFINFILLFLGLIKIKNQHLQILYEYLLFIVSLSTIYRMINFETSQIIYSLLIILLFKKNILSILHDVFVINIQLIFLIGFSLIFYFSFKEIKN